VTGLRHPERIQRVPALCREIEDRSNQAQSLLRTAMARLLAQEGMQPLRAIKLKDIIDGLDASVRGISNAARVAAEIALQNS
jgi:hypothetical protein